MFAFLVLAGCAIGAQSPTDDTRVTGTYENTLPAASGGGERKVEMTLLSDGTASVTSAFPGRPSRFLVKGTWERTGDQIVVNLAGPRPERLTFDYADGTLAATDWNRTTWGESGPGILRRQ